MTNNYVAYHIHSDNSLLDSCTKYKDYVKKAVSLGQTALGSSEHGNIYNWTIKKELCEANGLKYLHGCEVYLTEQLLNTPEVPDEIIESLMGSSPEEQLLFQEKWIKEHSVKIRDNYHTILIAKNYEGIKELNSLVSISTDKEHFYYKPRLSFEEFFNISDNIIKISACLASPLNKFPNGLNYLVKKIEELKSKQAEKIKNLTEVEYNKYYKQAYDIYCNNLKSGKASDKGYLKAPYNFDLWISESKKIIENFYNEKIQNILKHGDDVKETYEKLCKHYDYYEIQYHNCQQQKDYNKMLLELSKKYNKPLIAGTDTHSLNSYKAECRSILQKAKKIEFSNEDEFDLTYKSYDELVDAFVKQDALSKDIILEAINNTCVMADSVENIELDLSIKYPHLYDNDEEIYTKRIYDMFQEKIDKGIIEEKDIEQFKINIEEEIRVFKQVDMMGFMLSMSDICMWAKNNNRPLGFARGSVGGSSVAYITDIIDINPVKWKLVFSRFCNEHRLEVGD